MATRAKEISGGWRIGRKRSGVCEAATSSKLPGHLAMSKGHLPFPNADPPPGRDADTFPLVAVLVLAASLLLGACAAANDPVLFGGAGGGNGGAGATSGVSVSW
jgi:hypothetical protein